MKKLKLFFLFLLLPFVAKAYDAYIDKIYYVLNTDAKTATVTYRSLDSYFGGYLSEYSGVVNIPETITYNGSTYSVTSIGNHAFYYCTGLTSVTIPNSVTSIGGDAFYCCSGLKSINIPNSVTTIGYEAFYGTAWYNNQSDGLVYAGKVLYKYKGTMPSGTSITLEKGTLGIADYAFYGCTGLTSMTIPNSVTSIGDYAFRGCSGLTSVTIPNSVTSIGRYAFSGCSGLTSVTIEDGSETLSCADDTYDSCPIQSLYLGRNISYNFSSPFSNHISLTSLTIGNSVTSIGWEAFKGCTGLTSVTIPNSVTSIGTSAFFGCTGLTSVTIPNSVTSIGSYAFLNCTGLTSVTIPNSVTYIEAAAFSHCSSLTSINIPNSVTSIRQATFNGCSGLTSIEIPNSVTSIEPDAFSGCSGLTSVTIPNSVTYLSGFNGCFGLTSVAIPNSVTSIGDYAFRGCSGLTSVTIPNSVTSIYRYAFSGCSGLKVIRMGEGIKRISSLAFANCQKLEDVWCYAVTTPNETAADAFQDSYINHVTLHVPKVGLKQYKAQEPWKGFMKIVPIETPENIEVTLSDAGYATFYDEAFDYAISEGVKASVVTKATDSKLTYKVIAEGDRGDVIPAGVAVLLEGTRRSADTHTLHPAEATTIYTGTNLLHGSDEATTTTADGDCLFYKLAYGPSGTALSNTLGWYWGEDEGKPFTIEGHKAWLAIPKTSAAKSRALFYAIDGTALTLEMEETNLTQPLQREESLYYDLQGRRVTNVTAGGTPALPGIYIRNGKKVYVK